MLNMNYNDFLTRQQQIKKLSIAEQKNFYEQLLKKKYDKTEVRILASFYYGQLFYQEGNFRKTIEIIEPIIVDYQRQHIARQNIMFPVFSMKRH